MNKSGINKTCRQCGMEYYVQAYRAEGSNFCSMACVWLGRPKREEKVASVICKYCHATYEVPQFRVPKTTYCSRRCSAKDRKDTLAEAHRAALKANPRPKQPEEITKAKKQACDADLYRRKKSQRKIQGAAYYQKNKAHRNAMTKAYAKKHGDRLREIARQRRLANADAVRAKRRQHYRDNKSRYVAQARAREHLLKRATPPWVDMEVIVEVYDRREKVTVETGVLHHVDHIVPIRGKNVCGLHVPWNLQVIPAVINLAKSNSL